jgi:hypothetical protein
MSDPAAVPVAVSAGLGFWPKTADDTSKANTNKVRAFNWNNFFMVSFYLV